ncbi:MAG: 5-formyltetrahydrofolate cyclo-ligase [Clostridia bacterium]|nr:5-formyltetrahydrofolate cyclo-ligase [Clostridia bacterium]
MGGSGMEKKRELRRAMRALRDGMSAEARRQKSAEICARAAEVAPANATILVYAAFRSEVDTAPLMEALWAKGCRVCLPLVLDGGRMEAALIRPGEALARDRYGIPSPDPANGIPPEALDMIFVPGLAFDERSGRLGYGAGYYDRYLARARCPRYGLAFAEQLVPDARMDAWDAPVDGVITDGVVDIQRVNAYMIR